MDTRIKLPIDLAAEDLSLDALRPYYQLTDQAFLESVFFEGSRFFTLIVTSYWSPLNRWDKVAKNLYLGMLPSFGQYKQLIQEVKEDKQDNTQLGLVVSVVTMSQLAGIKVDPPSAWKAEQVHQHFLHIPDFTANTTNQEIINTILLMQRCINNEGEKDKESKTNNKAVFVHCKAGKSRSAMICLIYLYFFGKEESLKLSGDVKDIESDVKLIEAYLKTKRVQVEILPGQRQKALEVINIMRNLQNKSELDKVISDKDQNQKIVSEKTVFGEVEENKNLETTSLPELKQPEDIKVALKEKLSSLHLKNEIVHMPSFLAMGYYALSNQYSWLRKAINSFTHVLHITQGEQQESLQKKYIKDFLISIYNATDETWYLDLINSQGPLADLIKMNTASFVMWSNNESDKEDRKKLCAGFIDDLNQHLATLLSCSVEEIKQAAKELSAEKSLHPQHH